MPSIDLDDEFLELFYNITNSKPPKELELLDLKKQWGKWPIDKKVTSKVPLY